MQVTNQQTESMVEYYNCRAYEGRSHRLSCNPDMLSDEEHAVMFNTMMHEMNAHSRSTKIFETRHCSRKSNGDPKSLQKPLNPWKTPFWEYKRVWIDNLSILVNSSEIRHVYMYLQLNGFHHVARITVCQNKLCMSKTGKSSHHNPSIVCSNNQKPYQWNP